MHPMNKAEARRIIKERKSLMSSKEVQEKSKAIGDKAFQILQELEPTTVAVYLAMPDEVQTDHLIHRLLQEQRHQLVIPRVDDATTMRFYAYYEGKEMKLSNYKIWEPMDEISEEVIPSVVMVPGVAFDRQGGRVGRGKGFYDRYFGKHQEKITHRIAICYELQLLDEVPMDELDLPMHQIVTENEIIDIQ